MTAKEKELLVTEMKELEALMTVASNFEGFLFSASFHRRKISMPSSRP